MSIVRLVGDDSISINGALLTDFGHGEVAKLTFNTDVVTVKTGKSGNVIYAKNATGNQATLELKVLRGSPDDARLQAQLEAYNGDSAAYVLMYGSLSKNIGKGDASKVTDTYTLTGGVIQKNVEVISNIEGDVEQAISVYTIAFALAPRTIA
jgi:hypothetical protein